MGSRTATPQVCLDPDVSRPEHLQLIDDKALRL